MEANPGGIMKRRFTFLMQLMLAAIVFSIVGGGAAWAQDDKPNILVVWGDDIGQSNISAYTRGMMGYETPNIDRIANEGMIFTDYYGEQSCTAGRSSFITGQSVFRTGLSKVGLPGAELGMRAEDPTIAGVLKDQGYATGQFGKNHLGDRDEHLPTNHGFDEFFGNLYHLNAEEEPENEDYPGDMVTSDGQTFREQFGPRGVIHSWADGDGSQRIEDTGPLTKKRMETVDDETSKRAIEFIREQHAAGKPWFVWWSGTRMHFRTHVKEELRGISGQDEYSDGMVEHDMHIGKFLDTARRAGHRRQHHRLLLDRQRPALNTWPDAAIDALPRREEHQLGRRLARAGHGALARQDRSRLPDQRDRPPHGLAADLRGHRGRHRREGAPARGRRTGGQQVQGPPRRLQHPAPADRGSRRQPAPGDLLLLRRRRPDRPALRRLEAHLHGAAGRGHLPGLAGALRPAALAAISSTCAAIPTNAPRSPRTPTTTGCSTGSTCWCRPRPTWAVS